MNNNYDPEFKARAVRLVQQQRSDYPSMTAVCHAVGTDLGISRETLRRWARQSDIDAGQSPGIITAEHDENKRLRKENTRLRESNEILKAATVFCAGELDPPQPMIIEFIDQMRSQGHTVESTCRVLREQGVAIAARTYRHAKSAAPSARAVSDAEILDTLHGLKGTRSHCTADERWSLTCDAVATRSRTAPLTGSWMSPG